MSKYKEKLFYKPNNKDKDGNILCGECGKTGKGIILDAVDMHDPKWRHYAKHRDCKRPEYRGDMMESILSKISKEEILKEQVKKMEGKDFDKHPFCLKCDKPMLPDKEAVIFGTDRWDEHSWKFDCNCIKNKNIRLSIG